MSKAISKNNIDHVTLTNITVVNASVNNKSNMSVLPHGIFYDFDFSISPAANVEEKWLRFIFNCTIKVFSSDKRELPIESKFEIAYVFAIDNLHEIAKSLPNNMIEVKQDVLDSLYNITYSTSRGIIYTRCQGTILKNVIIPVVSTPKLSGQRP